MGTFLKIVGIIYIILAILLIIFFGSSIMNLQTFIQGLLPQSLKAEEYQLIQVLSNLGYLIFIILSLILFLPLVIGGAALYAIGSIYNDVKNLKKRFSNVEIVTEESKT